MALGHNEVLENGTVLQACGQTWKLAAMTQRMKADFEVWCRQNARRDLILMKAELRPDDYRDHLSVLQADIGAGRYNWDGDCCRAARGDLPGLQQIMFMCLLPHHDQVTLETVQDIFLAEPEAVGLSLQSCLGLAGPNRKTPATATSPNPG